MVVTLSDAKLYKGFGKTGIISCFFINKISTGKLTSGESIYKHTARNRSNSDCGHPYTANVSILTD